MTGRVMSFIRSAWKWTENPVITDAPPGFQTTPHWLFVKGRGVRVLVPRWWIITVELLAFGLGFAVRGLW